jgi:hypothetical protein
MSFWAVVWVVLMIIWLVFGCWWGWDPQRPGLLGNTVIPWLCVAILGAAVFGGLPVVIR